jgi:hypothetical protein
MAIEQPCRYSSASQREVARFIGCGALIAAQSLVEVAPLITPRAVRHAGVVGGGAHLRSIDLH